MTNKEKIQKIVDEIKSARRISFSINEMVDILEKAVKDLEVLEILKPMLEVKKGSTWFYLDTKHCFFDTQEQLDLVKEWSNDK